MHIAAARPMVRAFTAIGVTALLAACADPVAPSLDVGGVDVTPNAREGLDPSPGTLRETFGTGSVVTGDRDLRFDVCPPASACYDAFVLERNPRWAQPIDGTQWIGPRPIADNNNSVPVENDVYVTTFNLPAGFVSPVLNVRLYADNAATVYVNGVQIGQQEQGDVYPNYGCTFPTEPAFSCTQFRAPFPYTTTGNETAIPWRVGSNELRIVVLNATYKQGCQDAAPGDPQCKSATALDLEAKLYYALEATGNQGCTIGYWKNHDGWASPYMRSTRLGTVFTFSGPVSQNTTFDAALRFGGGSGLQGAQQNLFRQSVAALLNAASTGVAYRLTTSEIITQVNAALATNDRATILRLADTLDRFNNAGCPLGNDKAR